MLVSPWQNQITLRTLRTQICFEKHKGYILAHLRHRLCNIDPYDTPVKRDIQHIMLMFVKKMTLYKYAKLRENAGMSRMSTQMIIAIIIPRSPEI
jgi:hypothetical protein